MESDHAPLSYQESLAELDHASRDVLPFFSISVGDPGIEPGTSFLSGTRSTTEPITHFHPILNFSCTLRSVLAA